MNITVKFIIFGLADAPSFILNKEFKFFGPNLPKKGIFGPKPKQRTSPSSSVCPN